MFGNKVGHLGRVGSLTLAQRVSAMFSRGEPGAWYDPSDLSTLFQDEAGTTPVTAVEQPVGRMLDKSGRGNHATQATTTKRPVYSRRVNQMVGSEAWDKMVASDGVSVITKETTDIPSFLGATSVARVTRAVPAAMTWYQYALSQPVAQGAINTRIFHFKPVLNCLRVKGNTSTAEPFYFAYDLQTKVMTVGTNAGSAKVDELPNGWLRFSVTQKVAEVGTSRIFAIAADAVVANDPAVFLTTGYDSRLATDAHLPYQWVNTSTDYDADPSKFPAYLCFDGVDDALQTGNIDFTGTDKMTVWAGVTPLLAGGSQYIAANFGNLVGRFALISDSFGLSQFESRGSSSSYAQVAPLMSGQVLCGRGDISGDVSVLRRNGAQVASSVADQGTGDYGNAPLIIGGFTVSSSYFNGRLYGLIARGAQSTLSQIEATELYSKQKMRMP